MRKVKDFRISYMIVSISVIDQTEDGADGEFTYLWSSGSSVIDCNCLTKDAISLYIIYLIIYNIY